MSAAAGRLAVLLDTAPRSLVEYSDSAASEKREGRWSKKQILGHLIDSASNNHQRFVRTLLAEHHEFPRYQQNEWVESQRYQDAPWADLVNLWLLVNRHLLHIMRGVPTECLGHTVSLGGAGSITLQALMDGYLEHLEHHLDQIHRPS